MGEPWIDSFIAVADRLGVPVAFLLIIAFAIWRVAKWVAPRADELISRHFKFMDGVVATQIKLQETIEEHRTELREWRAVVDHRLGKMAGNNRTQCELPAGSVRWAGWPILSTHFASR